MEVPTTFLRHSYIAFGVASSLPNLSVNKRGGGLPRPPLLAYNISLCDAHVAMFYEAAFAKVN